MNPTSATSKVVLRQLTNRMTMQSETNRETNNLRESEFECIREKVKTSKDRLKKLHKSITNQILMVSASHVVVGD